MTDSSASAPRQLIDLTRETDVAYWCRIFAVSMDQLREAVQHAGHDPADVQRYLAQQGGTAAPGG